MRRKSLWMALILPCLLLFTAECAAQIGMRLEMSRQVFMQYEPLYARLVLQNDSGRALVFGADERLQGKLYFEIIGPAREKIPLGAPSEFPLEGLILGPGEKREIIVPVGKYYPMHKLGFYTVHAYITHPLLKDVYKSNETQFEINSGVPLPGGRKVVGKPEIIAEDHKSPNRERIYVLKRLTEGEAAYYYVAIEDASKVYAVLRLGRSRPAFGELRSEVDHMSNLHVLFPYMSKIFRYIQISTDGDVEVHKYYKADRQSPNLHRDAATGRVWVTGGVEAAPGVDFEDPTRPPAEKNVLPAPRQGKR